MEPTPAIVVAEKAITIYGREFCNKSKLLECELGITSHKMVDRKNLEKLAGEKQIGKWFSAEGVVAGNYAASDPILLKISSTYEEASPEVEHMSYNWVDEAFGSRTIGNIHTIKIYR